MLTVASFITLVLGGSLAYAATNHPLHAALLERLGGMLMIVGLAILGTGLAGIQP